MKHTVAKLAALFSICFFSLACGGTSPANDASATCSNGSPRYALNGTYTTVTASEISDGCNLGITATDLSVPRTLTITNDTLDFSTSGGASLANGINGCNSASLSFNGALSDSSCTYEVSRTAAVTVTGDHAVTVQMTENRSNFRTAAGGSPCQQTVACSIGYKLTMTP